MISSRLRYACAGYLPPAAAYVVYRLQTRAGLFQGGVGNLPVVWGVRSHPHVCEAFRQMYCGIRPWVTTPDDLGPMCTSVDGINIKPPTAPFATPQSATQLATNGDPSMVDMESDWAHIDQNGGKWNAVIQGQVRLPWCVWITTVTLPLTASQPQMVLSDTSAGFVCSPRSHMLADKILALNGRRKGNGKSGFCRLRNQDVYSQVLDLVRGVGGHFQVAVGAPRGSLVLWSSTTLHSARIHLPPRSPSAIRAAAKLPWYPPTSEEGLAAQQACEDDWRFVVYVCHRPLRDVGNRAAQREHLSRLQMCWRENRNTNHAGERVFGKRRTQFELHNSATSKTMKYICEDMSRVYEVAGLRPELTPSVAALLGLSSPTPATATAGSSDVTGAPGVAAAAGAGAGAGSDVAGGAHAAHGGQKVTKRQAKARRRATKRVQHGGL